MGVMEGDEMTQEDLQTWIREKVKNTKTVSPEMLKKYSLLQCLLRRREKRAADFLKLCQSVAECEAAVKKLYARLGWLYIEADSDDGRSDATSCVKNGSDERKLDEDRNAEDASPVSLCLQKEAVVVLSRYPEHKLEALRSQSPLLHAADDSLSSFDSDTRWEPKDASPDSDSDSWMTNSSSKRRKVEEKPRKSAKRHGKKSQTVQRSIKTRGKRSATATCAPQASAIANAKTDTDKASSAEKQANANAKTDADKASSAEKRANTNAKTDADKASSAEKRANTNAKTDADKASSAEKRANTNAKTDADKASSAQKRANTNAKTDADKASSAEKSTNTNAKTDADKASSAQKRANTNAKTDADKASSLQANANSEVSARVVTAEEKTKPAPALPEQNLSVGMAVLARRRALSWQRGKVLDIVTKEDGSVKYKVNFEDGKRIVSVHHIASDAKPLLEQLYVGARVVVGKRGDQSQFFPGVLAEVPNRSNRMRFLVFMDDHTPVYVGLPLLHLVHKPLKNVVDDIPEGAHKRFMQKYLKDWPFPQLIHYRVGQVINAESSGVFRKCEVLQTDSTLMEVVFQEEDKRKEWIHRSSFRLEANSTKIAESEKKEKEPSKSADAR